MKKNKDLRKRKSMMKKILVWFVFSAFILSMPAFAQGPEGNKRKGKYIYKKVYKACAARGEVESKTPVLSPSDKTMTQWKGVFEEKKFDIFKCSEEWGKLTEEEVKNIYSYLYSYAADSPTPATCK
jgi:hypothetical protein